MNKRVIWSVWELLRTSGISLFFCLALTVTATYFAYDRYEIEREAKFELVAKDLADALSQRVQIYSNTLLHVRSFFQVEPIVTKDMFDQFIEGLNITKQYPGVRGVGYTIRVPPRTLKVHESIMRRTLYPNYRIWPPGPRDEYFSILYLYPKDWRNSRAIGFDMFSEKIRREAMERARDTGQAIASGLVSLVQENESDEEPGFLIYLPYYKRGLPLNTPQDRRKALQGFVYSPFRSRDLLQSTIEEMQGENPFVQVEFFEGSGNEVKDLMYRSSPQPSARPEYIRNVPVYFGGRTWTLRVSSLPEFESKTMIRFPWLIFCIGLFVSLFIFSLLEILQRQRRDLHKDLLLRRETEEKLKEEKRTVELISQVGLCINAELDPNNIVQFVTDRATELTNAFFGAFFYNVTNEKGESLMLYTLSGVDRSNFSNFPMPRNTAIFAPTFKGEGIVRILDVLKDPRYGHNPPYKGMPDGHLPVRSYLAAPVISKNGKVIGSLIFGHPEPGIFTERSEMIVELIAAQAAVAMDNAQMYSRLDEANEAKSRFLANVSHEIRTPLGIILGFAELALDKNQTEKEIRNYLESIKNNGRELTRLLGEVLDLSKIEANRMDLEPVQFLLGDFVDEVVAFLKIKSLEKKIELKLSKDSNLPNLVMTDPTRLRQILINLIGNSLKFTEKGYVSITVSAQGKMVQFKVEDTGIGISEDQQKKLFQPFAQADSSMTRKYGGTGLGLVLSRQLARALGGELKLERSKLGEGSCFVLTILADTMSPVEAVPETISAESFEGKLANSRILVVDDSEDNHVLIGLYLKKAGAEVDVASNGLEAIEKIEKNPYDVILMDIQMPVMDGYTTAEKLREKNYHKPIIALTAHALKEERQRAFKIGFDEYLTKPIDRVLLLKTVSRFIIQESTPTAWN